MAAESESFSTETSSAVNGDSATMETFNRDLGDAAAETVNIETLNIVHDVKAAEIFSTETAAATFNRDCGNTEVSAFNTVCDTTEAETASSRTPSTVKTISAEALRLLLLMP